LASNIYNKLSELYKIPLVKVAQELKYSEPNILILQQRFSDLKAKHSQIWSNISSCVHNADRRSPEEYALDLVSSWVFEDTILKYGSKHLNLHLNGSDKNREILFNKKVSSASDFLLGSRHLELINSYTKYWKIQKQIDLRDNKYKKLKAKNALLLCVDVYCKNFFILDLKKDIVFKHIESHEFYGGKPAYRLYIENAEKHYLSMKNIIKQLDKIEK